MEPNGRFLMVIVKKGAASSTTDLQIILQSQGHDVVRSAAGTCVWGGIITFVLVVVAALSLVWSTFIVLGSMSIRLVSRSEVQRH